MMRRSADAPKKYEPTVDAPPITSVVTTSATSYNSNLMLLQQQPVSSTHKLPSSVTSAYGTKKKAASTHEVLLSTITNPHEKQKAVPDAWGRKSKNNSSVPCVNEAVAVSLPTTSANSEPSLSPQDAAPVDATAEYMKAKARARAAEKVEEQQRQLQQAATNEYDRGVRGKLWDPSSSKCIDSVRRGEITRNGNTSRNSFNTTHQRPCPGERSNSFEEGQNKPVDPEPEYRLRSYDDRDRGEPKRGAAAAPRMLYDPKTGSMVTVDSLKRGSKTPSSSNSARTGGGKDSNLSKSKDPKKKKNGSKKPAASTYRLPRTRGVRFTRKNGEISCADGCEGGDLGYGVHSVPGGRVRNAAGYAVWQEEQKSGKRSDAVTTAASNNNSKETEMIYDEACNYQYEYGYGQDYYDQAAVDDEKEEPLPPLEWNADEKLELVTSSDTESPTLKPTAKVFAPSQAALAAVAAAKEDGNKDEETNTCSKEGQENDGLEQVDTSGSATLPPEKVVAVDDDPHSALAVDHLLQPFTSATGTNSLSPRNGSLFSFGSSGNTWGATTGTARTSTVTTTSPSPGLASGLDGWGMSTGLGLRTQPPLPIEDEGAAGVSKLLSALKVGETTAADDAAAFLKNPWGSATTTRG